MQASGLLVQQFEDAGLTFAWPGFTQRIGGQAEQQRRARLAVELGQAAGQLAMAVQVRPGLGDALRTARAEFQDQVLGDPLHGVQAAGIEFEPEFGQRRLHLGTRRGALGDAAQPFDLRPRGALLHPVPEDQGLGIGMIEETGEATGLATVQVVETGQQHGIEMTLGEADHAGRPGLARQFLALHEVEQRHQGPAETRVARRVGRLEDDRQQAADQVREGRGGLFHPQAPVEHAAPQTRQAIEQVQDTGDAVEQARAILGQAGVEGVQAFAQTRLAAARRRRMPFQGAAIAIAARPQQDIAEAALALQVMYQCAGALHQFAGQGKPLQLLQFATAGRQHETQGRGHLAIGHGARLEQEAGHWPAKAAPDRDASVAIEPQQPEHQVG